jgi:segregation and condensation protein A
MSENQKIPPTSYDPLQVNLPVFDGPLDLLLHLVRKQAFDINEVRLADLTEPYLGYLERMKELNLDHAGEFLTIASTLIWIKSRTLLPRQYTEEEPDAETVEEMLLLRLQEYQKFKEAAFELSSLDMLGREVFARRPPSERPERSGEEQVFGEVSLFALIEAFRTVLEKTQFESALHLIPERERVEDKIADLLTRLSERRRVAFRELLSAMATRSEVILAFIALLELVRMRAIRVVQPLSQGDIHCEVTDQFGSSDMNWTAAVMASLFGAPEPETPPGAPPN